MLCFVQCAVIQTPSIKLTAVIIRVGDRQEKRTHDGFLAKLSWDGHITQMVNSQASNASCPRKRATNHFNMPTHCIFCIWHVSEENSFREFKVFIDRIFHMPLSAKSGSCMRLRGKCFRNLLRLPHNSLLINGKLVCKA